MAASVEQSQPGDLSTYRDTVESIGVAIVLAFVLRAFVIEAFVIPTGSMAPRLMGDHWDLVCPACGFPYAYGCTNDTIKTDRRGEYAPGGARCPNCGTPYPSEDAQYINGGDRVLVMKYLYEFSEPQPFDVVVFKNPQDNHENYIKRLIGLPGETIEIVHGHVFVSDSPDPNSPRRPRRKPPRAQEAMWQVVYDNDYQPDPKYKGGETDRAPKWAPQNGGGKSGSWDANGDDGRCFKFSGGSRAWIHLNADRGAFFPNYGYNSTDFRADAQRVIDRRWFDPDTDVCTDMNLSAVVMPRDGTGAVRLELSNFDIQFEAEFGADGKVTLDCRSPDLPGGLLRKTAQIAPMKAGEGRRIALTDADFRAAVWVDGRCVIETSEEEYPGAAEANHPGVNCCYQWLLKKLNGRVPTPEVKISASGGACELRHVALYRDIFYTRTSVDDIPAGPQGDYARAIDAAWDATAPDHAKYAKRLAPGDTRHRPSVFDNSRGASEKSRGWGTAGMPIHLMKDANDSDLDEFFVLGDNSPQSRDCRMWTAAAPTLRLFGDDGMFLYQLGTVPRYNLLGKAMFVYWPSGFRIPIVRSLPIIPNVGKMRFIR